MHWVVDQHYLTCGGGIFASAAPLAVLDVDRDALLDRFAHVLHGARGGSSAALALELVPGQAPPHVRAYAAPTAYPDIVFLDYGEALDPRVIDRLFSLPKEEDETRVRLHLPSARESVDVTAGTCISKRIGSDTRLPSYALLGEDSYYAVHTAHGTHPEHMFRGRAELFDFHWPTIAQELGHVLGTLHFRACLETPEWALVNTRGDFRVVLDLARCRPILDDASDASDPDLAERLAAQLTRIAYVPSPEKQPQLFAAFAKGYRRAAAAVGSGRLGLARRVTQEIRNVFLS